MSKFIDLADEVGDLIGVPISSIAGAHVEDVLRWLDRHPEKVPGRTITAGEVGQWSHLIRGDVETPSIIDFLEALGITVVPDSKPTNAEKLEQLYRNWSQSTLNTPFGEWANSVGVKAPEEWESND